MEKAWVSTPISRRHPNAELTFDLNPALNGTHGDVYQIENDRTTSAKTWNIHGQVDDERMSSDGTQRQLKPVGSTCHDCLFVRQMKKKSQPSAKDPLNRKSSSRFKSSSIYISIRRKRGAKKPSTKLSLSSSLGSKYIHILDGIPRLIISDRDSNFTSDYWTTVFQTLGTKHLTSTSWNPQTDGQSEATTCIDLARIR